MAEGHRLVLIGRRGGGAAFTGFTATSSALDTCIIAPAEADRGVRIHFDANKQSQQQNQQNKKQSHASKSGQHLPTKIPSFYKANDLLSFLGWVGGGGVVVAGVLLWLLLFTITKIMHK